MTIKSHNSESFIVSTAKFGTILGELELTYARLGMANATEQAKWAVRNGFSQAATDSHAGDTEDEHGSQAAATKAAQASFEEWKADILAGHVPTGGVGSRLRLSPFDRGLREATIAWAVANGMKKTQATKQVVADGPELFVMNMAVSKAGKTGGDANAMFEKRWTVLQTQAQAFADALAPEANEDF